jgi:hypothetical protein
MAAGAARQAQADAVRQAVEVAALGRPLIAPQRGLTSRRSCNTICIWSETTPAAQAKVLRNAEEVETTGTHHPPAVKVEAGVFVPCRELCGLYEVQGELR